MLRIQIETTNPGQWLLRLEGDVRGRWVDELRRVCDDVRGANDLPPRDLVLDLGNVLFIDAPGVALCRELNARQARFTNCSPFIAEQLREVTDARD